MFAFMPPKPNSAADVFATSPSKPAPAAAPAPAPAPAPALDPAATATPADPQALLQLFASYAGVPMPSAADVRQHRVEELVRIGKDLGAENPMFAAASNDLSPEERTRVEAAIAHDQHLDALASMATLTGGASLEGLAPDERREVERQLRVRDLTAMAHHDFDKKKLTNLLESLDDPDERARVLEDYRKQTGETLQSAITANTDEDSHYRHALDQLVSPDRERAERTLGKLSPAEQAEKMKWAREQARTLGNSMFRSKTDKSVIFNTLGFNKPEDIEAIRRAFREVYPEQDGLMNELDDALGGDNEREAVADLDQGAGARKKAAAAGMRNAFTGFGHKNDRARMKEILGKLSPEEIKDMREHPDQYGDILHDVQKTMHGYDDDIVAAYISGDKALATGMQIAEDIGNDTIEAEHIMDKRCSDNLSKKALFDKLANMDPKERAAAVAAFDKAAAAKEDDSLAEMMKGRFDDYDLDRGRALLDGDLITAKAAQAEGAIDRKGTDIDNLEEALADANLSSTDPVERAKAEERRRQIEAKIANYHKGTLLEQVHDEKKLAEGKDNRVAFDEIYVDGKLSMGMQLRRAIEDDNTEKGKELLLNASAEDLEKARALFARHGEDWNGSLDDAVRKEWDGANGTFIQMDSVLRNGAREDQAPLLRAYTDKAAHDADRDAPTGDEMSGKSKAGKVYDAAIEREMIAAMTGKQGEEFAFAAENSEAASKTYAKQKEEDAEGFVERAKLLATVATMILAPELLPLVIPALDAMAIAYKEHKLGKHYAGENREIKGLYIDAALSVTGVVGEGMIAARQSATAVRELQAVESTAAVAGAEEIAQGIQQAEHLAASQAAHDRLRLELAKNVGGNVANGVLDGKSAGEMIEGVVLTELATHVSVGVGNEVGARLDKLEGVPDVLRAAAVGTSKAAASLPFDATLAGVSDPMELVKMFGEHALEKSAEAAHEHHAEHESEAHVDEKVEHYKQRIENARKGGSPLEILGSYEDERTRAKVGELNLEGMETRFFSDGVLSVEDARALQRRAAAMGVAPERVLRASRADEVLVARGLTPEELAIYKSTLNADQQASRTPEELAAMKKGYDEDSARQNMPVTGSIPAAPRRALTPEQKAVLLKANCLLYEDFVAGAMAGKVVPEENLGAFLHGANERGEQTLYNDVGMLRNHEGLAAGEKVGVLGLDYKTKDRHPYVDIDPATEEKRVRPDVATKLYQVEQRLTERMADSAQVIFGPDMYDAALASARELHAAKARDPNVVIPRMLELDGDGKLKRITPPRARANHEDPSTGLGYTASMGLRDEQGRQYFKPNQELTLAKGERFSQGAELVRIDGKGRRQVIAVYDEREKRFVRAPGLGDDEWAGYQRMQDAQREKLQGARP